MCDNKKLIITGMEITDAIIRLSERYIWSSLKPQFPNNDDNELNW